MGSATYTVPVSAFTLWQATGKHYDTQSSIMTTNTNQCQLMPACTNSHNHPNPSTTIYLLTYQHLSATRILSCMPTLKKHSSTNRQLSRLNNEPSLACLQYFFRAFTCSFLRNGLGFFARRKKYFARNFFLNLFGGTSGLHVGCWSHLADVRGLICWPVFLVYFSAISSDPISLGSLRSCNKVKKS